MDKFESTSRIFEATESEPYKFFYRIQNAKGEGPYSSPGMLIFEDVITGESEYIWAETSHSVTNGRPDPGNDLGFDDRAIEILNNPKYPISVFGFSSIIQLRSWFSPKELQCLSNLGFEIVQIKARRIYSSGKQAFCHPGEYSEW